jgi:DNA-binding XRE family transcriptional regulator
MTPDQIKKGRGALGLNQGEFAELVGVLRSTVCSWEKGHKSPQPQNLAKLKKLFGEKVWHNLTSKEFAEILCDDRWQFRPELMMLQVQAKLKEKNT